MVGGILDSVSRVLEVNRRWVIATGWIDGGKLVCWIGMKEGIGPGMGSR